MAAPPPRPAPRAAPAPRPDRAARPPPRRSRGSRPRAPPRGFFPSRSPRGPARRARGKRPWRASRIASPSSITTSFLLPAECGLGGRPGSARAPPGHRAIRPRAGRRAAPRFQVPARAPGRLFGFGFSPSRRLVPDPSRLFPEFRAPAPPEFARRFGIGGKRAGEWRDRRGCRRSGRRRFSGSWPRAAARSTAQTPFWPRGRTRAFPLVRPPAAGSGPAAPPRAARGGPGGPGGRAPGPPRAAGPPRRRYGRAIPRPGRDRAAPRPDEAAAGRGEGEAPVPAPAQRLIQLRRGGTPCAYCCCTATVWSTARRAGR